MIFESESIEDITKKEFDFLKNKYHIYFEKNIDKLYNMETLFKTIEYMRKHHK